MMCRLRVWRMLEKLSRLRPNVLCHLFFLALVNISVQFSKHFFYSSWVCFTYEQFGGFVWEKGSGSNLCLLLKAFTVLVWVRPTHAYISGKLKNCINSQIYRITFSSSLCFEISLYSLACRIYFIFISLTRNMGFLPWMFCAAATAKLLHDWHSSLGARLR